MFVKPPAHRALIFFFVKEKSNTTQGGITLLRGQGIKIDGDWGQQLYRFDQPQSKKIDLIAVPYCVWGNRDVGEMRVWLRELQ